MPDITFYFCLYYDLSTISPPRTTTPFGYSFYVACEVEKAYVHRLSTFYLRLFVMSHSELWDDWGFREEDDYECERFDAAEVETAATELLLKKGYDAALHYCRDNATLSYHKCATYEELMLRVIRKCWDDFVREFVCHNRSRRARIQTCVRNHCIGAVGEWFPADGRVWYDSYKSRVSKYIPFLEQLYLYGLEEPTTGDMFPEIFYEYLWRQSSGNRRRRFVRKHFGIF